MLVNRHGGWGGIVAVKRSTRANLIHSLWTRCYWLCTPDTLNRLENGCLGK